MTRDPSHDSEPIDLSSEEGRERWQNRLRAAGITPATEFEERSDRVVFRKPSRVLGLLRSVLRIR